MVSWSLDAFNKAWQFATIAHNGQSYGGTEKGIRIEYINHVGSVAVEVMAILDDSPELNADLAIQCALLHDTIEDTEYTFDEIQKIFGGSVARGVLALSKDENIPNRNEQMIDSINRIKKESKEVWIVKLADRITNLYHPPYYWNSEKKLFYIQESLLIEKELGGASSCLSKRLLHMCERYNSFV